MVWLFEKCVECWKFVWWWYNRTTEEGHGFRLGFNRERSIRDLLALWKIAILFATHVFVDYWLLTAFSTGILIGILGGIHIMSKATESFRGRSTHVREQYVHNLQIWSLIHSKGNQRQSSSFSVQSLCKSYVVNYSYLRIYCPTGKKPNFSVALK